LEHDPFLWNRLMRQMLRSRRAFFGEVEATSPEDAPAWTAVARPLNKLHAISASRSDRSMTASKSTAQRLCLLA
jgi:hypothetical protein